MLIMKSGKWYLMDEMELPNQKELKQMDQRTRKLMTVHKALCPWDDIDRLYVSRKKGGRGLVSTEDSIDTLMQWLKDYI